MRAAQVALFLGTMALAAPDYSRFQPVINHGELTVAAVVVTAAPYNADNTGRQDVSAVLQRALNELQQNGGGTAYLPAGRYRMDHGIIVPHTVTLCGDWQRPRPGQPLSGTVLLAYADRGNADGPALLTAPQLGHANVYNLTIYYPEQSPSAPVPYPFSVNGRVSYVYNLTLVNSYQGVLMSDFSGGSVGEIYGTTLKRGIVLKSSCELCSCTRLRLNSDYWTRLPEAAMTAADAAQVRAYVARELVGVQVGKVDGLSFYDADLAGAHVPVLVKLEDDETKVMVAPRSQYGFGGGLGQVAGRRTEIEGSWYFGSHFFDLDNFPELARHRYTFAPPRQAEPVTLKAVWQAGDSGVKADATTDDSSALQRALDHAGTAGGGTVLLPRGRVRLGAPITVPAGVELRGGYLGTPVRAWFNNISTLVIDCDADSPDPENARAAISLQRAAGLRGVDVCCAKNLWELDAAGKLVIHPYPYAIRGVGPDVYLYDLILPNVYYGIDLGQVRCDRAQVIGLWGTSYRDGIRVGGQSDSVHLENLNFDVGPLTSDYRLVTQFPGATGDEKRKALQLVLDEGSVCYRFGDCTRLSTFDLAGFAPRRFMEFVDQGHGGCRDAEFWSSVFDVPKLEIAQFAGGGAIRFYGLFATGGNDTKSLWAKFEDAFHGSVDLYGLCQQQRFNNAPFTVGPDRLRYHLEHSLTTGQPVTASSFQPGFEPAKALDSDPRTLWQAAAGPDPAVLTVTLAKPSIVTRWRVHNAGTFLDHARNTAAAELSGSSDGVTYTKLAEFRDNVQDWVDLAVSSETPVRYVRLTVLVGRAGPAMVAAFDVFGRAER